MNFFEKELETIGNMVDVSESYKASVIGSVQESWREIKNLREELWAIAKDRNARKIIEDLVNRADVKKVAVLKGLETKRVEFRLPTMQLPVFDGDPRKWPNFKEGFETLVINNGLKQIECLFRLQESLKGEPRNDIDSKVLMGANFAECWKHLQDMFENDRIIVMNQIDALFSLPEMTKDPNTIRHLLCEVRNVVATLGSRGIDTRSWDSIFNKLILG